MTQPALAQTPLTLRVGQENVVAGSWAQIKVYADQPTLITKGTLALDLDPLVFGPIERVGAFSANGDASGLARVTGTHVEMTIQSPSGGIGQLPEVPVVVVRVPILPTAPSTGFVSLSLPALPTFSNFSPNYPADAWAGPNDKTFTATLASGRVNVGPDATIHNVTPGGGFQPTGTALTIEGANFSESNKPTAPGLSFSSVKLVSPTKVEATLASAAEITGARFQIRNSNNQGIDYFASPLSALPVEAQDWMGAGSHTILPFAEQQRTSLFNLRPMLAILQNPTVSPVEVQVHEVAFSPRTPLGSRRFILEPGSIAAVPSTTSLHQYFIVSETPLRMLQFLQALGAISIFPPSDDWDGELPPISLSASPNELSVTYQTGGAAPDSRTVRFLGQTGALAGTSIQVTGAPWLSASQPESNGNVTLSFNPSGLAPGIYKGVVTGTPPVPSELSEFPVRPATVQVTLLVSDQPALIVTQVAAQPPPETTFHTPVSLNLTTNGTPANFTASVRTDSGGNWLSIDRTSGTTPATINIQTNTAGLAGGYYYGTVSVAGPLNTVEMGVSLQVRPFPKVGLTMTPTLTETREEGTGDPLETFYLSISNKSGPVTLQISTDDGANWLSADVFDQNLNASVRTHIESAALAPGTYHGTIVATAGAESAQSRITLNILPRARTLPRLSPSTFHFQTSAGVESAAQILTIETDGPAPITFTVSGPVRIKDEVTQPLNAPRTFKVVGYGQTPGTFRGSLTVKNSFGSATIPVTVDITGEADRAPLLSSIVNAASHRAAALAPGAMITLRGSGVGPFPTGLQLDSEGRISTSPAPDTRVEINGQAAPVLYASPNQWNVIVPYEVSDRSSATVRVVTSGTPSQTWTLPVAPAAPAIFTLSTSGVGQGAVLNQDNTVNSPTNPAPAGTIIQIFGTGGGQTNPAAATGSVTPASGGGGNQLPVKVFFADSTGTVVFAGPAPGFASGALQVNVVVPPFGRPVENKTLPLSLEINGVRSPPVDVTIR